MSPNQSTLRTGARSSKRATCCPPTPPVAADEMSLAMRKLLHSGCGGRIGTTNKKAKLSSPSNHPDNRQLFTDVCDDEVQEEEEDQQEEQVKNGTAPKASRCDIEMQPLNTLIQHNCFCRHCGGEMNVMFKSIGIATIPHLQCGGCKLNCPSEIETTSLGRGIHPRTSDYDVNCQHVTVCIASGDGGSEAGRILGFLVASDLGRRPFWSWSRPFFGDLGGRGQLLPFSRPKVAKIL